MNIQITYDFHPDQYTSKMKLIKILKNHTGLGLKEAKDKVDCNDIILQNISHKKYLDIVRELKEHIECGNITIKKLDTEDNLSSAKMAIYYNTDCVLLTKEEYTELYKYKGMYKDLKGSLDKLISEFK